MQALRHAIRTLHGGGKQERRIPAPRALRQPLQPLHTPLHLTPASRKETRTQPRCMLLQLGSIRHSELRCLRRRCCPAVTDKIRERCIRLVSDSRDHGNPRCIDRTHNRFLVECPQILRRAAAAPDNEHIHGIFLVEEANRRCNLLRCLRSLHENWMEYQLDARPTPLRNLVNIAQHSTGS